jgi:hypothetical protein
VSSGSARRGRRDNGLDAAEYAAAGDVDPRVGEHLLDVLALQGIAAYLQPAIDLNPVTRSALIPSRPTDRLFVDRAHLATARDYLAQLAEPPSAPAGDRPPRERAAGDRPPRERAADERRPRERAADERPPRERAAKDRPADERPPRDGTAKDRSADERPPGDRPGDERDDDLDDAWAEIVAGYDTEVDAATVSWPEAENLRPAGDPGPAGSPGRTAETEDTDTGEDDDEPDDERDGAARRPGRPSWEAQPSLLTALDTFGTDLPGEPDDDEGYTPPPPPPLPRISKYAVIGVLGIVAGFVLFIKPSLLPIDSDVSMLIGFTAILAGFGTLVWRLRPGDDEDDYDPSDGARV